MDLLTPPVTETPDSLDPKQWLSEEVDRVRAERDDLERQIAADRERLTSIRAALDAAIAGTWRDVFGQQQSMRDRENLSQALTLAWFGSYMWFAILGVGAVAAGAIYALQATGVLISAGLYLVLATIGYFVARDQCLGPVRKARDSYLNNHGKDIRFVAFTQYEPGLQHPLIGFDGPTDGQLQDRAWKIPGVRDKDALEETFVEVIDERRSNVLLTRFPDKKPTLVHADLENPFVRTYGVFFQRALERHLPAVKEKAEEFRQIAQHMGQRKTIDETLRKMEAELHEVDGTAAIMRALPVSSTLRDKLLRQVLLFRLGDGRIRRGMFLVAGDRVDTTDVLQTLARASAATLLQVSFSQIKIGYVGQGASTITRLFDTAKRSRSILFIDEADKIFATAGAPAYEAMRREVVQAIYKEWEALEDRTDVWVVAAATTRDGVDEGAIARFGTVIDFSPPSAIDEDTTTVITGDAGPPPLDETPEPVDLPEPVVARNRLLAAMFAHVGQMEAQGVAVPRAVLIVGPWTASRQAVIASVSEQAGLPIIETSIDEIDDAMLHAREAGKAIVAVDVPEWADPGSIAHLAVLIDELAANKTSIFILATAVREDAIDPELRARFPELVDLRDLDPEARRSLLIGLLDGKPLDFVLDSALDALVEQTDGMTEEQLRAFADEALRKAALRAIDGGSPEHIVLVLEDFERRSRPLDVATKGDEAEV